MPSTRKALRWIGLVALAAVSAVLGLALLVMADMEANQWLLRWRAERLMAEMHQIRLYQSTWGDAQRLMHEWGAWGHYDGSCTAEDCYYQIELGDHQWIYSHGEPSWWGRLILLPELIGMLNARESAIRTSFTVHKGTIWRTGSYVMVDVPAGLSNFLSTREVGAGEYSLIVNVSSRGRLRDTWLGRDHQLADHPWYKAGRPSGCTFCIRADVGYSTHTPPREIERLTTFDFSCLTRWRKCEWLGDLLPAAREWNLYDTPDERNFGKRGTLPPAPRECDIPLWALGRDATSVHAVRVLSHTIVHYFDLVERGPEEKDVVVVVETLKGAPLKTGQRVIVWPLTFGGEEVVEIGNRMEVAEHMEAGKRYLILDKSAADAVEDPRNPGLPLDRCGVQPDTPEVRRELKLGFQMNDDLKERGAW